MLRYKVMNDKLIYTRNHEKHQENYPSLDKNLKNWWKSLCDKID